MSTYHASEACLAELQILIQCHVDHIFKLLTLMVDSMTSELAAKTSQDVHCGTFYGREIIILYILGSRQDLYTDVDELLL